MLTDYILELDALVNKIWIAIDFDSKCDVYDEMRRHTKETMKNKNWTTLKERIQRERATLDAKKRARAMIK